MLIGTLAPNSVTTIDLNYVPEFLVWRRTKKIKRIRIEIFDRDKGWILAFDHSLKGIEQVLPVSKRINYAFMKFAHGRINERSKVTMHYSGLRPLKIWAISATVPRVNLIPDGL